MHRFYLPPDECQGTTLTLTGGEAHHAAQVLRVRSGESVVVLDGAGYEFFCEVCDVSKKVVSLAIRQKSFTPPLPYKITLLQAIPKGKIIESVIQKATELGVARIVPVLSERVTTQLDEESSADKLDKWRLTTIEAIKQCGQPWLPQIDLPITPKAFLARDEKFELSLVASLQNDSRHPREYFETFLAQKKRKPQSICIWVGPEGDFTLPEMEAIKLAGVLPITLGRLVLRCETAAIYCLSTLNYELGV
ncbi:MAG: RsmE family RNA methyltransferase [Verrucomicrobiota bacterium]